LKDTGKPLKLQGPGGSQVAGWLTQENPSEYSFALALKPMPKHFSFFVSPSYASFWWWYRTATEGAHGI
jgi:hypothetical protein